MNNQVIPEKNDHIKKVEICDLSIATECNFKCKMCYAWKCSQNNDNELMSIADWKSFIGQLEQLCDHDLKLNFSGSGEVLLCKGIDDLLQVSCRKFKISLNTNGYLIDEVMARKLSQTTEAVSLSLDGVKAQTHDHIRGISGAHKAVVSAIGHLRRESQSLVITINTVILEQNLDEIIGLVDWVEGREINGIIFQAVSMPNNIAYDRYWFKNDFSFLWPKNRQKIEQVIDELIYRKQAGGKIVNSVSQLRCFKSYFSNPEAAMEGMHCEVDRVLKINDVGDIRFCDFSQPVGNVKTEHLQEILTSKLAESERRKAYACKQPCHLLINCFHDQGDE